MKCKTFLNLPLKIENKFAMVNSLLQFFIDKTEYEYGRFFDDIPASRNRENFRARLVIVNGNDMIGVQENRLIFVEQVGKLDHETYPTPSKKKEQDISCLISPIGQNMDMKPLHLIVFHALFCLACIALVASRINDSHMQPRLPQLVSMRLVTPYPGDFSIPGERAQEMEKE